MRFFTILSIPSFFFLLISFSPLISCSTLISCTRARFEITNYCPYTVWAAAIPGGGMQLNRSQTWPLYVDAGKNQGRIWAGKNLGRIWARTKCSFNGAGRGSCETGDCGGLLECQAYGVSPTTLVEFTLNSDTNIDIIDMSLLEGFNVPMEISSTSGGCNLTIKCTADINGQCPTALKVPGGCNGPCPIFKTDQYCCNSSSCGPTEYSRYFKERCPDAYSYPNDSPTSVFSCPGGTYYKVVFCP